MFSKRKIVSSKVCIGPARASVKLNMNSYVFWFPGMALGPVRPSPALPGLWVDGGTELEAPTISQMETLWSREASDSIPGPRSSESVAELGLEHRNCWLRGLEDAFFHGSLLSSWSSLNNYKHSFWFVFRGLVTQVMC